MEATRNAAGSAVKRVASPRPPGLSLRDEENEAAMPIDATLPYDESNIFARILRGEIPCNKVYEDEFALAFHDIAPQAPVHILVIPKGAYVSWDDFSARASDAEIAGFVRALGKVARDAGLVAPGYRLLANVGAHGGQEVPHLHVHLFGGAPLGPMLARPA
jgi:diadenosine tetraphosphate (Ap4A) HIT family hydrolase